MLSAVTLNVVAPKRHPFSKSQFRIEYFFLTTKFESFSANEGVKTKDLFWTNLVLLPKVQVSVHTRNSCWKGRLSTIDLLIKTVKENYSFSLNNHFLRTMEFRQKIHFGRIYFSCLKYKCLGIQGTLTEGEDSVQLTSLLRQLVL